MIPLNVKKIMAYFYHYHLEFSFSINIRTYFCDNMLKKGKD